MSLLLYRSIILTMTSFMVTICVSCSPIGDSRSDLAGPPKIGDGSGGEGGKKRGTSDTGGGTGIDGKVFEGYQVSPYGLKASLEILVPLFGKFQPVPKDGEELEGVTIPFLSGKVWYIAPLELDNVDKDSLGLSFIGSETDQLARQSLNEVWIDKTKFDAMSLDEQAELILHELVMSEYLTRFKTWEEICQEFAFFGFRSVDVDENGEESQSLISCRSYSQNRFYQKVFGRAEAPRPLNEKDNEAIRKVTSWLLAQKDRPDSGGLQALTNLLLDSGFDDRKWSFMSSSVQEPLSLEASKVEASLKKVVADIFQFEKCYSVFDEAWRPCDFELNFVSSEMGASKFEMVLQDAGAKIQTQFMFVSGNEKMEFSPVSSNLYSGLFFDLRMEVKVGDQFFTVLTFFKENDFSTGGADVDVEYFALIPGRVYHVEESGFGTKTCLTSKIEDPVSRQTAPMLIARKNGEEVVSRGVLMQLHIMPAFLPCSLTAGTEGEQ